VVTLGASITDGIASAGDANRRWPNDLAVRLNQSGRTVGVLNEGISGNALLHDGAGQSAVNRFDRDVLAQPNVKWVIFADDPINDVNNSNPPSGSQLTAALTQIINAAHQAGVKFLCATLTPFKPDSGWTQAGENSRDAYDAFVRGAGSGCDGIVDFDTASHDPNNPQQYLSAYDSGDHLHPNTNGLQAMANSINLNLFAAAGPTNSVVSLRAHANGDYVTAENAGASPLIANRTSVGTWEQFDLIDLGGGNVSLRAHADNDYVTAENAGASPLIASRTTVGAWETFALIQNPDNSVSLKAVNGDYVTAENAGASALIANRTAIGAWEEFDIITD
jgi:lysophospholipase L1-like esterase